MDIQYNLVTQEKPLEGLEALVPGFLRDRKSEFEELKVKISQGDSEYAVRTAHSWKGFCHPYGFTILGDIAIEMDRALKEDSNRDLSVFIMDIEKYLKFKTKALADD